MWTDLPVLTCDSYWLHPGTHLNVAVGRGVDIPRCLQPFVGYVAQAPSSSRVRAEGRASDGVLGESVRRVEGVRRETHGSKGFGEVANLSKVQIDQELDCCGYVGDSSLLHARILII